MPTCGIFQKCDISAVGSVARVHPDPMAAIFALSSLSWLNRVLWDWNLTHYLGVIRQGNYMVAEANDKFRPLSNAVHCCMLLLTLLVDPHLENIIHLVMGRKYITV